MKSESSSDNVRVGKAFEEATLYGETTLYTHVCFPLYSTIYTI